VAALGNIGRVLRSSNVAKIIFRTTADDKLRNVMTLGQVTMNFIILMVAGDEWEKSTSNAGIEVDVMVDDSLRPVCIGREDPFQKNGESNDEMKLVFVSLPKFYIDRHRQGIG
jgi:hypothetical protein